jgi:uncharacterized heparinase superfamily protein
LNRQQQFGRYVRTVRHLRADQLAHRVRLRAQKHAYRHFPAEAARVFARSAPAEAGWPGGFQPLDARTETVGRPSLAANVAGEFDLLGERHDLGRATDWQPAGASQLWRYHLHYFDWAWVALAAPRAAETQSAFATLYRSWRQDNPVGRWDAWSPYVVALRAWTLCSIFEPVIRGSEVEAEVRDDLGTHARYLRANVEFDVGGNHLLKDLKALAGLAVFLGDGRLLRFAVRHLARQLDVQILDDGGHFERSPGYHAQVLGDLIDIAELLEAAETTPGLVARLEASIGAMRSWLAALVLPDGSVPLLNDSVPVSEARLRALGVEPSPSDEGMSVLEDSGYVVVRPRPGASVVMDVGAPCPDELPAHAQADALSVLVHVDGDPVLVEAGTSTYTPGERRQYERSTAAHNTVEIDGEDQTEVWGTFRAGRRHRTELLEASSAGGQTIVVGKHDGYRHLPGAPVHRRSLEVAADGLHVRDEILGEGKHDVILRWHLADGAQFSEHKDAVRIGPHRLTWEAGEASVRFVGAGDAPLGVIGIAHNETRPAPCVEIALHDVTLPVRLHSELQFAPPVRPSCHDPW